MKHLVSTTIVFEFFIFFQRFSLIIPDLLLNRLFRLFLACHIIITTFRFPVVIGFVGVFVILHNVFLFKFIILRVFKLDITIVFGTGCYQTWVFLCFYYFSRLSGFVINIFPILLSILLVSSSFLLCIARV